MIAFTNHALDHMLTGVLDAGITKKIVRLGGMSKDERIAQFSLENLELVVGKSGLHATFKKDFAILKEKEKDIERFMDEYLRRDVTSNDVMGFIRGQYPEHAEHISAPPVWIQRLFELVKEEEEGWTVAGASKKSAITDTSIYAFWLEGRDISFLQFPFYPPEQQLQVPLQHVEDVPTESFNRYQALQELDDTADISDEPVEYDEPWESPDAWNVKAIEQGSPAVASIIPTTSENELTPPHPTVDISVDQTPQTNVEALLESVGVLNTPVVPLSNRAIEDLLEEGAAWEMSASERQAIHQSWSKQILMQRTQAHEDDLVGLQDRYREAQDTFNNGKDEVRLTILLKY